MMFCKEVEIIKVNYGSVVLLLMMNVDKKFLILGLVGGVFWIYMKVYVVEIIVFCYSDLFNFINVDLLKLC